MGLWDKAHCGWRWPLTNIQTMYFPASPLATNAPHPGVIYDFSLVIGDKLHSEYLVFSLLAANCSRNILFFFTGDRVADSYVY